MKPFTISGYKKDPSKLSSRLKPDEPLSTEHEVISGNRLMVEIQYQPGRAQIYGADEAAERFVLRTQYRELKVRPWKDDHSNVRACPEHCYNQILPERWCGPEQTILVED